MTKIIDFKSKQKTSSKKSQSTNVPFDRAGIPAPPAGAFTDGYIYWVWYKHPRWYHNIAAYLLSLVWQPIDVEAYYQNYKELKDRGLL